METFLHYVQQPIVLFVLMSVYIFVITRRYLTQEVQIRITTRERDLARDRAHRLELEVIELRLQRVEQEVPPMKLPRESLGPPTDTPRKLRVRDGHRKN